jgi:hypothetical protein
VPCRLAGLLLVLTLLAFHRPGRARPCGEEDVEVIEALGAEWAGQAEGQTLDDRTLDELAAQAGCEWLAGPGGPAEELDRLRWREGPAVDADGGPAGASFALWWRVFLPRVELRWVGVFAEGGVAESRSAGWSGRLELWLLWSLVPLP